MTTKSRNELVAKLREVLERLLKRIDDQRMTALETPMDALEREWRSSKTGPGSARGDPGPDPIYMTAMVGGMIGFGIMVVDSSHLT
jgi:hypothetical protein